MSGENNYVSPDMFKPTEISVSSNEKTTRNSLTFWQDAWMRLRKNKGAFAGVGIIWIIIFLAIFGPYASEHSYKEQDLKRANLPPKVPILEKVSFLGFDGLDIRGVDRYEKKR